MREPRFVRHIPWVIFLAALFFGIGCEERRLVFEKSCSRCHNLARPLALTKEPDAWRRTVARMAAKSPEPFLARDRERIYEYLISCCTPPVEQLFVERCGICHEVEGLEALDLSAYEWAYMADVCRSRVSARIGVDEARRIVSWLHGRRPWHRPMSCVWCHLVGKRVTSESGTSRTSPILEGGAQNDQERFLLACGRCHTSRRLTAHYGEIEWSEILERMKGKSPAWLTQERMHAAERHIRKRAVDGFGPWPFAPEETLKATLRHSFSVSRKKPPPETEHGSGEE